MEVVMMDGEVEVEVGSEVDERCLMVDADAES